MSLVMGLVVPGQPHPLLAPEQDPSWGRLRAAFDAARERVQRAVAEEGADLLVIFSTQWASILGHQVQADPQPEWVHVDQEFHELGSIPYRLTVDVPYAEAAVAAMEARGLHARTVSYHGFPVDTGSIVASRLLNPDDALPVTMVSCNMYSDRAETIVLGKACRDAAEELGRKAVFVAVTSLSDRMHTRPLDEGEEDFVSSLQDDEWNRKLLELFGEGRLEDVSQLARTFTAQAHADSKLKAVWWLAAAMGQHNRYAGEVLGYGPLFGTGGAVVSLVPSDEIAGGHEFDEEDVEVYGGDRSVLDAGASQPLLGGGQGGQQTPGPRASYGTAPGGAPATKGAPVKPRPPSTPPPKPTPALDPREGERARTGAVETSAAPKPVGAYPHARRVGDFLFLSGCGPRQPGTDAIPGGPIRDAEGKPLDYDIKAQTRAVIENLRVILEAAGSSLDRVVDVTSFLVDMDRDFAGYNEVYAELLGPVGPTRTTLAVRALPTPIAVEMKVTALAGDVDPAEVRA